MNKSLEEIVYADAATTSNVGPFGKGQSVLEQTLRDFIQLQSTQIAVGTQVVGVRTVNWLTFKWYTGASGIIQARADAMDNKILTDLLAGAGQTKAATAVFGAATADEEKDILDAMDLIFANARVSGNEPVALILPASVRSVMMNTQLYGNVVESLEEHLRRVANLRIYYTRDYGAAGAISTSAILMIPGAETAEMFQYNGEGYMETEMTRIEGIGFSWLLTSYYGMVIHQHQDGAASGKSNRICKITGVIA